MKIKLISVGKIKEDYLNGAIKEYLKRLNAFCELECIECKEINTSDINKNIVLEGENILNNIKNDDYVITLEIEGSELDSVSFANFILNHYTYDNRTIVFVIGGSNGLSEDVKKRSNKHLSFSKFTFPHQLMRVIFLEQLYRAFTIINNKTYHK